VLARIPRRATTVLTSARGRPWTASGLSTAVQRAKAAAGWDERDLHFHDLRGTAATKFYVAGLSVRVIAEIMGWDEEQVEKIIRRYVGRQAATLATIAQIRHEERTDSAKPSAKLWSGFELSIGAGEGNRTLVISLEGCCSTIELHPHVRGQGPGFRGSVHSGATCLDSNPHL